MNGVTIEREGRNPLARQPRNTDLNNAQWEAVRPVLLASLAPHFLSSLGEGAPGEKKRENAVWTLRDYADALAYISRHHCRWKSIPDEFPPTASVYRFNRMLRERRLFRVIRGVLGESIPFGLEAHYQSAGKALEWYRDHREDARKCGACPRCAENSMICYKTRKQGSRIVRYYRCEACGHKRVWLELPQGKGWQGLAPALPSC